MRLALTFCALSVATGALMLAVIYVFMRYVPSYDFAVFDSETVLPTSTPWRNGEFVEGKAGPIEIGSTDTLLNVLLTTSAIVLLLLTVAGVAVGWWVAGRMLAPLLLINEAARRAATGALEQRVALVGPRDEISDLATTFDHMLDRLQHSLTTTRRFAANASHELRTPLATSRAMLDAALARNNDESTLGLLQRLRSTNERSITIVEALLDLAEVEATVTTLVPIDLATITSDVVSSVAGEASSLGLTIEQNLVRTEIESDVALLRQLISNLVQNAIRHNVQDGFVRVVVGQRTPSGPPFLEITNGGPALSAETVSTLTEPFVRAGGRTSSPNSQSTGRGLGLSIVSAIAQHVDAEVSFNAREQGGLRANVDFPSPL